VPGPPGPAPTSLWAVYQGNGFDKLLRASHATGVSRGADFRTTVTFDQDVSKCAYLKKASIVATDGTVTDGSYPQAIGGLCAVDVPSREEALTWAAKTAVACRCAQDVRELMPDPTLGD
jgi:hypothetical protein